MHGRAADRVPHDDGIACCCSSLAMHGSCGAESRREKRMITMPKYLAIAGLIAFSAGCGSSQDRNQGGDEDRFAETVRAASANGSGGDMPAFYDCKAFTINFKELPSGGEGSNLAHNGSINTIYQSDACMPAGE